MSIAVLAESAKRGHEQVTYFNFPAVGLKAIVGVHNSVLGPALGGCRMRLYEDESKALDDVLRLSEGMTYKSSLAGLDLGGGKAVIIGDPKMTSGRRELFRKFGWCLNSLSGRYITAEDMGTSVEDMMTIKEMTPYVSGFSQESGGGGDPSPWTALGVFLSMKAMCKRRFGTEDLAGRTVAVQGVGHVGKYIVDHLIEAGANVTACDTHESSLKALPKSPRITIVGVDEIYDAKCEIFSPNAIGQTINPFTIERLRCDIICGAANNQLSDETMRDRITTRGILYGPDFTVNAGGIICCAGEFQKGGWSEKWVRGMVERIYDTTGRVLDEAEKRGAFTEVVALELARERIDAAEAAA